jgi:hypothetical protein
LIPPTWTRPSSLPVVSTRRTELHGPACFYACNDTAVKVSLSSVMCRHGAGGEPAEGAAQAAEGGKVRRRRRRRSGRRR